MAYTRNGKVAVQTSLDVEEFNRLEAIVRRSGLERSAVLRRAVQELIANADKVPLLQTEEKKAA